MKIKKPGRSTLPELLAPAGSPDALAAGIEGGADALYLGLPAFGARAEAINFDYSELDAAVRLAHAYGVKVYVTLNTVVTDREMSKWLSAAQCAYSAGVDAAIVADTGAALLAHKYLPDLPLHASTQAGGHSVGAARALAALGFSRMVAAREMTREDISVLCSESPVEIEMFVHGALCVCHSGQCLMSSLIGGRSGNRGECAQPCRLPYGGKYPLSLKDLCLAGHIPELIRSGVASLKIEGRMKSPEYVFGVTKIYRRLLDEGRAAYPEEIAELAALFSRGGFTDGYYCGKINHSMLGIRSSDDKQASAAMEKFSGLTKKIPLQVTAELCTGEAMRLTLTDDRGRTATACGSVPERARTAPTDEGTVRRALGKYGGTPYCAAGFEITLDDGLMLPISQLNALRRDAVAALEAEPARKIATIPEYHPPATGGRCNTRIARFAHAEQITPAAREYFDIIYLPLSKFTPIANGVILPPVIMPHEEKAVSASLAAAVSAGVKHIMLTNIGQSSLTLPEDVIIHGDYRLNITNSESAAYYLSLGFSDLLLSPELRGAQLRDIAGNVGVIVYGRIPMMLIEKCVISELWDCHDKNNCSGADLTDRRGVRFPVLREAPHRNTIYNSVPLYMADRADELTRFGASNSHFILSIEDAREVDEIIAAYKNGTPPDFLVRRIT